MTAHQFELKYTKAICVRYIDEGFVLSDRRRQTYYIYLGGAVDADATYIEDPFVYTVGGGQTFIIILGWDQDLSVLSIETSYIYGQLSNQSHPCQLYYTHQNYGGDAIC